MNARLSNLECKVEMTDSNNFYLKYELIYFIRDEMYKINFNVRARDLLKNEILNLKNYKSVLKTRFASAELRSRMSMKSSNNSKADEIRKEMDDLNVKLNEKIVLLESGQFRTIDIESFTVSLYILNKNKDWSKLTFANDDLNLSMSINDKLILEQPSKSYYKVIDKFTEVAKKTSEEYLRRFTPKKKAVIF